MKPYRRRKGYFKAKRVCKIWRSADMPVNDHQLKLMIHTRKRCSCMMCGNPRRFHGGLSGRTLNERRIIEDQSIDPKDYAA